MCGSVSISQAWKLHRAQPAPLNQRPTHTHIYKVQTSKSIAMASTANDLSFPRPVYTWSLIPRDIYIYIYILGPKVGTIYIYIGPQSRHYLYIYIYILGPKVGIIYIYIGPQSRHYLYIYIYWAPK